MTKQDLRDFRNKTTEVRQIEEQIELLSNLGPKISNFDKILVDSGRGGSPVEQTVEKIIQLQERYEGILGEYLTEKIRIEKAFEVLTPNERTALRYYYFERLTWEQAAERMEKSTRYILSLHKWALIKLKNI